MTTEAHVINVKERTDRWTTFQESWKDMPLTLNRRDAIKPDGVEVLDVYHAVFLKHREILTTAQKLGEKMYAEQAQAAGAAGGDGAAGGNSSAGKGAGRDKDDGNVVDAEYTEVKDKKS